MSKQASQGTLSGLPYRWLAATGVPLLAMSGAAAGWLLSDGVTGTSAFWVLAVQIGIVGVWFGSTHFAGVSPFTREHIGAWAVLTLVAGGVAGGVHLLGHALKAWIPHLLPGSFASWILIHAFLGILIFGLLAWLTAAVEKHAAMSEQTGGSPPPAKSRWPAWITILVIAVVLVPGIHLSRPIWDKHYDRREKARTAWRNFTQARNAVVVPWNQYALAPSEEGKDLALLKECQKTARAIDPYDPIGVDPALASAINLFKLAWLERIELAEENLAGKYKGDPDREIYRTKEKVLMQQIDARETGVKAALNQIALEVGHLP
jgi:hypothetical protein